MTRAFETSIHFLEGRKALLIAINIIYAYMYIIDIGFLFNKTLQSVRVDELTRNL